jgi:hypothetical protein
MDLHAASRAAADVAARINAKIKTRLVRRALKNGMTEAEGIDLADAWKRAGTHTGRLRLGDLRKAHRSSSGSHSDGGPLPP